jgi:hypothetical protein
MICGGFGKGWQVGSLSWQLISSRFKVIRFKVKRFKVIRFKVQKKSSGGGGSWQWADQF